MQRCLGHGPVGRRRHGAELIERQVRSELERIDEASRFERAKRDAELDRKIAYLAAEYRRLADVDDSIA
jgi:hypothetical protein